MPPRISCLLSRHRLPSGRRRFQPASSLAAILTVAIAGLLLGAPGCQRAAAPPPAPGALDPHSSTRIDSNSSIVFLTDIEPERRVYMFDGHTGEPVSGREMRRRMRNADVVLLGETHTDATAHQVQQRLAAEGLSAGSGALSLEMLTREDARELARLSNEAMQGRGGTAARRAEAVLAETSLVTWPQWRDFYLPVIQTSLRYGRPVVGANAPRAYVRAARVRGYEFLDRLDERQRRLFDLPDDDPELHAELDNYRARFAAVMAGHDGLDDPQRQPSERREPAGPAPGHRGPVTVPEAPEQDPEGAGERPPVRADPEDHAVPNGEPPDDPQAGRDDPDEPADDPADRPGEPPQPPGDQGSVASDSPRRIDERDNASSQTRVTVRLAHGQPPDDQPEPPPADPDQDLDADDPPEEPEVEGEEPQPEPTPVRDPAGVGAFFEAQLVWDATMARSIKRARGQHGGPIVHLVGSFHSDFEGGLTTMLRREGLEVMTVSFVPVESGRLRPQDIGRAEIVIYTGAAAPLLATPDEPAPEQAPEEPADEAAEAQVPPVMGEGPAAPPVEPIVPDPDAPDDPMEPGDPAPPDEPAAPDDPVEPDSRG